MIVERKSTLLSQKIAAHTFMMVFIAIIMFPFFVVISISFREGNFAVGDLIPRNPTLEHWYLAFGVDYVRQDGTVVTPHTLFYFGCGNSAKIAFIAAFGVLIVSTISAYAFSRIRFKGRSGLLDSLFIIQMFPTTLALVALYSILTHGGRVAYPWHRQPCRVNRCLLVWCYDAHLDDKRVL